MNSSSKSTPLQRLGMFAAVGAVAVLATWAVAQALDEGDPLLNVVVLTIFFALTTWTALGFAIATIGFWRAARTTGGENGSGAAAEAGEPLPRTAILLPVYNEDPDDVSARIEVMAESIRQHGQTEVFDFFILSDSTNPDVWLAEEQAFLRLKSAVAPATVYYRHRKANLGRKSGNIADFCTQWGAGYRYMVVLDADSLMTGRVLTELVRRMEADPHLGILQTSPLPLGDRSLVSRRQQFSCKLCGPLFVAGLDWAAGDGGNYWGHNAIIRTAAFTQHCGLGKLPGEAPLGGEVLSHDFVEAALMGGAGFKVQLAADLVESYEQTPTTLPDHAQRDLRWCQGNLQHARLVVSRDIPLANRLHFASGVMAYASSLLWLLFLMLWPLAFVVAKNRRVADALFFERPIPRDQGLWVFALVMAMLLAPLAEGFYLAVRSADRAAGYGGPKRLFTSALVELLASILLAPIFMAFHSMFIISTMCGYSVKWQTQNRTGRGVSWWQAWRVHWWQSVGGAALAGLLWLVSPAFVLWVSPVLVSLIAAVPLCVFFSSPAVGQWFRDRGYLEVPEERTPPAIIQSFQQIQIRQRTSPQPRPAELLAELLIDPAWMRMHLTALAATAAEEPAPPHTIKRVEALASENGWSQITAPEKRVVLCDPAILRKLHLAAWNERAATLGADATAECSN